MTKTTELESPPLAGPEQLNHEEREIMRSLAIALVYRTPAAIDGFRSRLVGKAERRPFIGRLTNNWMVSFRPVSNQIVGYEVGCDYGSLRVSDHHPVSEIVYVIATALIRRALRPGK